MSTGCLVPYELSFYLNVILGGAYQTQTFRGDGAMMSIVERHLETMQELIEDLPEEVNWKNKEEVKAIATRCEKYFGQDERSYYWVMAEEYAREFVDGPKRTGAFSNFLELRRAIVADGDPPFPEQKPLDKATSEHADDEIPF